MKVVQGLDAVDPPLERTVLTIGNFDGVHRAHQQLLAQAGLFAANTGGPVVVLTFEPHPLTVVAPEKAPPRLSLPDEKLRRLAEAGADMAVVARSEPALMGLDADRFVREVIWRRFQPTHIVEGPSFGFGRGRKGTPELLTKLAGDLGCEVHIIKPVTLKVDESEASLITSSLIRRLVGEGDVGRAAQCLGRPYALCGEVIEGARRGQTLGFPTANLAVTGQLVPGDGVYAGRAVVREYSHRCAISIGHTPTFGVGEHKIEAYLLESEGELYGEPMRLEFERRLRSQRTFESADALVAQLKQDVQAVRETAIRPDPYSISGKAQDS